MSDFELLIELFKINKPSKDKEIEEAKATIKGESILLSLSSTEEQIKQHTQNIAVLEEYIKWLNEYKE